MDIEKYSKIAPQFYSNTIPKLLEKYIRENSWNSFLDCGCGDGSLLFALNHKDYFNNKKVFAVDLSENRINLVKRIKNDIKANVDNVEILKNIEDNSIDFFVSTQVIEHVDDKKMSEQIERVTKNNSIIYITTVFKKWYGWYFYKNNKKWVLDPTHIREYTKDEQLLNLFNNKIFYLIENKKTLQKFPISDYFVKRLNIKNRKIYNNVFLKIIRKIKIPILGYYNWEIILIKK